MLVLSRLRVSSLFFLHQSLFVCLFTSITLFHPNSRRNTPSDDQLLTQQPVLPPISTKGLTPADVDNLARTTREAMLKCLAEMSNKDEREVDATVRNGKSSAVEI